MGKFKEAPSGKRKSTQSGSVVGAIATVPGKERCGEESPHKAAFRVRSLCFRSDWYCALSVTSMYSREMQNPRWNRLSDIHETGPWVERVFGQLGAQEHVLDNR